MRKFYDINTEEIVTDIRVRSKKTSVIFISVIFYKLPGSGFTV